nr:MAG TPA: hypothetical protein [Bacteriophage sp.]
MQKRSETTIEHAGNRDEEIEETFNEMYERVVISCFRYLGFKSIEQVNNVTPYEYRLLMKSKELQMVDDQYYLHLQAYLNMKARAKKRVGKKQKMVYTKFNKFFDYEKEVNKVLGVNKKTTGKFSDLSRFINEKSEKEG